MIFFLLSILSYLVQNFSNKQFSQHNKNSGSNVALFQNALCTFASSVVLALCGGIKMIPFSEMLLAVLFGATYLLTVFLLLKAFNYGALGASTLLCNIGAFICAAYGILRFNDDFTTYIALGCLCIIVALLLSTPWGESDKGTNMKWFIFAIASGLANGAVSSVKREAVAITGDVRNFLVWGFFFAALIATVILLSTKNNRTSAARVIKNPLLVLFGIGAGVGTAGGNCFQMEAVKTVSPAIIYPFTAGFLVVSMWLVSLLIYKETTVKWQNVLAVIFCVTAIIFINL